MKTAALLIAVVILMLLMPASLDSTTDFRTDDQVDPFNVTTNATETTATVTLSQDLFGDATGNAVITSNLTTDAAIASTYTAASNALLVTGLSVGATRRLSITYKINALSDYYGAETGSKVLPLLLIVGIIGIIAAAVYNATKSGE